MFRFTPAACSLTLAATLALGQALSLTITLGPAAAAEATGPAPVTTPMVPSGVLSKSDAEHQVAAGRQAMQESNADPSRSVAAAVCFSKAISYYESIGDVDTVCDLEANIFWCKKRMTVTDVQSFLAQKAGDASVAGALAKADAVASREVPKTEAKRYFDRAAKYAADHPDEFEQISVHYFEVAERFVGTDVSLTAQKLSLEAQQQQMTQLQAEKEAARQTLFTRPAVAATADSQRPAVPSPEAVRSAAAAVRKLYKDDFAKTKPTQKRHLAVTLLEQVPATKDDPATQYALLTDAIELAASANDWLAMMCACDLLAKDFAGIEATAKKKEVFGKAHTTPVVQAILKLLDNPHDADANAVVGKYFCVEGGSWEIGVPLLAQCGDADYKTAAEMEMLRPSGTQQQIELADKWFELSKKARTGMRDGLLARAFSWYKQAEPTVTGITKQRIAQRMEEIEGLLPMTNPDYDNLTLKQWERLKGATVEVVAGKDRNDIGISLARGQRVRVVPHPTDTWSIDYFSAPISVTWKGYVTANGIPSRFGLSGFSLGAMIMQVEQGKQARPGILDGEGRIFLGPYMAGYAVAGRGTIRCKILAVTDDEVDQGAEAARIGVLMGFAVQPAALARPADALAREPGAGRPAGIGAVRRRGAMDESSRVVIGPGVGGSLQAFVLTAEDSPWIVSQAHGGAWRDGGAVTVPLKTPFAMAAFAMGTAPTLQVICLDRERGQPFLFTQDEQGVWTPAMPLPNPSGIPLSTLSTRVGADGYVQVICLSRDTGYPFLLWQDLPTGAWTFSNVFMNPTRIAFSVVATAIGAEGRLNAILIGRDDGQPYLTSQGANGKWTSIDPLPNPAQIPYATVAIGAGSQKNLQAVFIGRDDGMPYLIWQSHETGAWTNTGILAKPVKRLAACAAISTTTAGLQVAFVGRDDGQPYAVTQTAPGGWGTIEALPNPSMTSFATVAAGTSAGGDLDLIFTSRETGQPYLITRSSATGAWTPATALTAGHP